MNFVNVRLDNIQKIFRIYILLNELFNIIFEKFLYLRKKSYFLYLVIKVHTLFFYFNNYYNNLETIM